MADKTFSDRGNVLLLTGNQAIARGVMEIGAHLVTGYPGTPTSGVIEELQRHGGHTIRAYWEINEKVAVEVAAACAWSGLKALVTMKMSGLNVASDSLLSIAASGTKGGLVVYVGDDPNVYYGMVEQDSRLYALMASIPVLEPSSPQEALDYTRRAFALSESTGGVVLLRLTPIVAQSISPVLVGPVERTTMKPKMDYDIDRYTKAGSHRCLSQHVSAIQRLEKARTEAASLARVIPGEGEFGVIAVGVSSHYVEELRHRRGINLPTLALGMSHPLPEESLLDFLRPLTRVLVIEELDPVVEEKVGALIAREGLSVRLFGKGTGTLPRTGDFDPDQLESAVAPLIGREAPRRGLPPEILREAVEREPHRLFTFCPGCPHRGTFLAANEAIGTRQSKEREVIVTGDIGCTILGMNPPFSTVWTEVSMGSSIGLASGYKEVGIETPVIATIGDGTFFHAGLPALLSAVHRGHDLTVVIMDNRWMSMTGYQPHVGSDLPGGPKGVSLEKVVRGLGVTWVRTVHSYHKGKLARTLRAAMRRKGVSVIISRGECAAMAKRSVVIPVKVDEKRCSRRYPGDDRCPDCIRKVGCPAIMADGKRVWIDTTACKGCWLCIGACPHGAIRRDWRRMRRHEKGKS